MVATVVAVVVTAVVAAVEVTAVMNFLATVVAWEWSRWGRLRQGRPLVISAMVTSLRRKFRGK